MRRNLGWVGILGLAIVGCATASTYWYNPNPKAELARDQQLSWDEAQQVQVMLTTMEQPVFVPDMNQGFGANMLRGMMQYNAAVEEKRRRAQEAAFHQHMAKRGWRQLSYDEAAAVGLVQPRGKHRQAAQSTPANP